MKKETNIKARTILGIAQVALISQLVYVVSSHQSTAPAVLEVFLMLK